MTVDEQLARIRRGTAEVIAEANLRQKLERSGQTGTPLRVKLGLDPTAPDLHLGHTVVLQKLRDFQALGHQAIIIMGDFTGMIGDPSGRAETRKPLSRGEIEANASTYRSQLGKILDMDQTRIEFNSAWLASLTLENLIRLTSTVTVAQLLQRDDFAGRYSAGRPISLHEFLYPICQAYDSVAIVADVELGGTDQTFNLLVGRDLQRAFGQEPQVAITTPILEGLDGSQKMSKSLGNYVGISEPLDEMYGKLMSIPDSLMLRYFTLVTRLPEEEIETIARELAAGVRHPMEAKKRLSRAVVTQYHGERAAVAAEAAFVRVFQERQTPVTVDEIPLPTPHADTPIVAVLRESGLVPSNSEARRMIQQGAVEVNGTRISDVNTTLRAGKEYTIKVGKRRFRRVLLRLESMMGR
ncbi:MAG: tyrosine--tRNA ligase [Candidatus Methylomirabilia bacterium]